jgi:hypothetical protein
MDLLNSWGWDILPHPPYSHDLVSKIKKHLVGQRLHSNEDVKKESRNV